MNTKRIITAMEDRLEKEYPDIKPRKISGSYLATVSKIETGSYAEAEHLKWMLGQMKEMDSDAKEKQMRWIGFIQGALWSLGYVSIDDWREMNTDE